MSRRNRGRGNRGFPTQAGAGLGNRRLRRRLGGVTRAPMELRAMGSTMTNGGFDPVPVASSIKVQHRVQLNFTTSPTAGTPLPLTTGLISAAIPGVAAWDSFRILKLDVWGSDTNDVTVTVAGPESDAAVFTDWGTPGSRRCALHIVPAFSARSLWQLTATAGTPASVPQFLFSSRAVSSALVINLTLELQTVTILAPVFVEGVLVPVDPAVEAARQQMLRLRLS